MISSQDHRLRDVFRGYTTDAPRQLFTPRSARGDLVCLSLCFVRRAELVEQLTDLRSVSLRLVFVIIMIHERSSWITSLALRASEELNPKNTNQEDHERSSWSYT